MAKKKNSFVAFIEDQLSDLWDVYAKSMFGGYGLYSGGQFFGIIADDQIYFKTNEATRQQYIEWGMGPFVYAEKKTMKKYYEVPPDLLEDRDEMSRLAAEAVEVAAEG